MINTIIISGRITKDIELKQTNSGVSVCSFTVANETGYGDNKNTNFIQITAWRKTAEFVSKYFHKGSMVCVEGQLQQRKWHDKEGNNRTALDVIANNIHFMESKPTGDNSASNNNAEIGYEEITLDEQLPF